MATHSNRLPMTQVPIRRSFKTLQKGDANASNCGKGSRTPFPCNIYQYFPCYWSAIAAYTYGYQVRSEDELSEVELLCLRTLNDDPITKKLTRLDFVTLFKGLKDQLETWPMFFHSKEESGIEMQQGFVTLWSNFLIAETLLASISIQPLVMVPNIAHGWKFKLYGYIWMMSVISDFGGIAVTAVFLGYILGCPNKVVWNWMCEIGWLRGIPSILVLLDATLTLVAIAYTCWILYGYQLGIVCVVVEVFFVGTCLKLADILSKAGGKVTRKSMQ